MTVVMHSILWQKYKQNTFSSLIPPQHGHSLELHHISSTTEWICLILIWGSYSYIGGSFFQLLCESFEEPQPKAYTLLMLYANIFKSEVWSAVDMVFTLAMETWLDMNVWPDPKSSDQKCNIQGVSSYM